MRKQDILLLFEYNDWANRRLLDAAAKTAPGQWQTPVAHSYGSLRGTLVHLLDTEYGWRMICQHQTLTPDLEEGEFPSLADLEQRWQAEKVAMDDYLATLTDEALLDFARYETHLGEKRARVLWHCLYHLVNHGTQHRSEAAAILTESGHSPGNLDFTVFLNERG